MNDLALTFTQTVTVTALDNDLLHVDPPHLIASRLHALGWRSAIPARGDAYDLWAEDGGSVIIDHRDILHVDADHRDAVIALIFAPVG